MGHARAVPSLARAADRRLWCWTPAAA